MDSMGHAEWREIDRDEYAELLPAVIALVEDDNGWQYDPAPEQRQPPFSLMVHEGARGERETWVGVGLDAICTQCGAFMLCNAGGEYIGIIGGDLSCDADHSA